MGWDVRTRYGRHVTELQIVTPWTVDSLWPVPPSSHPNTRAEADVDAKVLVWAHPKLHSPAEGVFPPSMDHLFFQSILGYVSDVHEEKEKMNVLLVMLMQHETETAPVMLPTRTLLGPLRWWVPSKMQGVLAAMAKLQGKTAMLGKYVGKEDYEKWVEVNGKRKLS